MRLTIRDIEILREALEAYQLANRGKRAMEGTMDRTERIEKILCQAAGWERGKGLTHDVQLGGPSYIEGDDSAIDRAEYFMGDRGQEARS
jgi:hypothetical protein